MAKKGLVVLVGAGPGDPGLLTLAGKAALESADVVLHDRLVGEGILAMIPPAAVKVDVGKSRGRHAVPQDEINRLIIRHALEGKTIVRLKGGDPYLFGRGAEELAAVVEADIPFRVVSGVTSAIAAPAAAGIPLTHRDYSSSVHILTGHGKNGEPPAIPYGELARVGGTLVFLMGLSAIGTICRRLIEAGMAPETPAALVENGSRPNQRRLDGTIATLPEIARREAAVSPAILVVGPVCGLARSLAGRLPLSGKSVLVVSSRSTGSRLAALLRGLGCKADEFAGIVSEALPAPGAFWPSVTGYRWIVFTSHFGADLFFSRFLDQGFDLRSLAGAKFAVVGDRTARALWQRGIRPDFVPGRSTGRALAEGLIRLVAPDERVLLYRAETAGDDLPGILRDGHVDFDDFPAYRTERCPLPPELQERIRSGLYDAVTFTSSSSVEAFAGSATGLSSLPTAFCIGETTAASALESGMEVMVSAASTIESMVEALQERLGK